MFFLVCLIEASAFLFFVSLYRSATRPDIWSFFRSTPGLTLLGATIIIILCVALVIHTFRKSDAVSKKQLFLAIAMNVVMVSLLYGTLEVFARALSKEVSGDKTLLGVVLYPREWEHFASFYRGVLSEIEREGSYIIYDAAIGWTVAPSRTDKTGLYASSAEGLRSPHAGMSFADPRTRHSNASRNPASIRIALIGDSMTYGYEVACEESWGHSLEALLEPDAKVLNFAIVSQGLSQTLLRYEKDVRPWRPQIVIIGVTSTMLLRSINVYPFLENEWEIPFARPRLVVKNSALTHINEPVPDPEQIFAHSAISELSDIHLDDQYRPYQWERGGLWSLLEKSYVFRFAYSFRPPSDDQDRNLRAMQLGTYAIQRLVKEVSKDGAIPLVVYLPYARELRKLANSVEEEKALSARMLQRASMEYVDPTVCFPEGWLSDAYMRGGHYSPNANTHIAQCLKPVIRELLFRNHEKAEPQALGAESRLS